jgi:CDP-glucose 4,6-dehydratase
MQKARHPGQSEMTSATEHPDAIKRYFSGKTVLVTGHTGFKGSWLTIWLNSLGARVVGFSNAIPTTPSLFEAAGIAAYIVDVRGDVRVSKDVAAVFAEHSPDVIFHLAAQSIVTDSYSDPVGTIATNVVGIANVLDQIRRSGKSAVSVAVTSDKVYSNKEWWWGYRESDPLGGKDPYSASKAAAEIVARAFFESYMSDPDSLHRVVTVRAGNAVGGGDWAPNRIVPDCIRAWSAGKPVLLRSPSAVRPWQHVLEPLSGYLMTAVALSKDPSLNGESFNFGPQSVKSFNVREIVNLLAREWHPGVPRIKETEKEGLISEARLLVLGCEKAEALLGWRPKFTTEEALQMTGEWYSRHYAGAAPRELYDLSVAQIEAYEAKRRISAASQ